MPTPAPWLHSRSKRAIDIAASSGALLLAAPLLAIVAVAVRLRLGAPVAIHQQRAGWRGEPISVAKFRSMTDESDADGVLLPDEQRLTRFGRLLRGSSLDELPQLWNVLRGDMSLVGPRPLPMVYVERYSAEQRRRLDARPGLTGWAQVRGRNALAWPDKLALDVWYVDNASLAVDLRTIVLTITTVLSRSGISAKGHATMQEFVGEV